VKAAPKAEAATADLANTAPVKVAPVKVASVKKTTATRVPTKKAPAPAGAQPVKKSAAKSAKVNGAELPKSELSQRELATLRAQLEAELTELQAEYERSISELNDLQQANTDGAGDDQADAGSKTFEREQEQSIANNRHDLIIQIQRAISRIDSGTYGLCENCGRPIPKARLQALPMATLDAACKAREERR
jgi:RNA polymerase-binding protein DksA